MTKVSIKCNVLDNLILFCFWTYHSCVDGTVIQLNFACVMAEGAPLWLRPLRVMLTKLLPGNILGRGRLYRDFVCSCDEARGTACLVFIVRPSIVTTLA